MVVTNSNRKNEHVIYMGLSSLSIIQKSMLLIAAICRKMSVLKGQWSVGGQDRGGGGNSLSKYHECCNYS